VARIAKFFLMNPVANALPAGKAPCAWKKSWNGQRPSWRCADLDRMGRLGRVMTKAACASRPSSSVTGADTMQHFKDETLSKFN